MKKKKELKKRPLNVLFLPTDDGGCGWYRIRQLHEVFQSLENVDSVMVDPRKDSESYIVQAIRECDVVVARLSGYDYVKLIKEEIDPDKPIIFDHDDNTLEVLPTSEHYVEFGTEDAYIVTEDGEQKPIWVTGYNGFNKYRNKSGHMKLLYMLAVADMITTPTQRLTEYYSKFTDSQCIHEVVTNDLDINNFPSGKISNSSKDKIRIGWQGGVSHRGDWADINSELEKVMEHYPEVEFHIMGSSYRGLFNNFRDRLFFYGWVPFKGYPFKLASLDLDLAIIPLEDQDFNTYKSEVKFSEFAKLQVPTLVKDMLPYSAVCKDGNNCFAYKNPKEFGDKLRTAIEDIKNGGKKCAYVAKNAKKWVDKNRDLDTNAPNVVDIYKKVLYEEDLDEIM